MPLFDYRCLAHGVFESFEPHCPHGCDDSMVEKTFLKPPGLHSDRTKNIDGTLRDLAADFGLTDLNNQNGTSACVRPDWKKERERNQLMGQLGDTTQAWGNINPGGTYQVGKGAVSVEGRNGSGAVGAISSVGAQPGDSIAPLRPVLAPPIPQVVARHDAAINTAGEAA